MNKITFAIAQISSNALAIIAVVIIGAGLFDALVFRKSIPEHQSKFSDEQNRLMQGFNYQSGEDFRPGYQSQFLASNTLGQAPSYVVTEAAPTGIRLKTIVNR